MWCEGFNEHEGGRTGAAARHSHRHFWGARESYFPGQVAVSKPFKAIEISCDEARGELVEYMERDLGPDLRARIDHHLSHCRHCTAVYDGVRNVVQLIGPEGPFDLPDGFSRRLYQRFLTASRK
jgi:Putative zinc-finger